ncbi:hypothetical protein GCM10007913_07780 [Devosia yakushimensis]|uniref:Uncharacterized protein n=1 Tax=Devosia yakushimensis TaxID=470028 RepID=A0ABQ5UE79_9HYPH|nr:hypothetical protein GCM10007913_07780 [Devosia yakushimensis]
MNAGLDLDEFCELAQHFIILGDLFVVAAVRHIAEKLRHIAEELFAFAAIVLAIEHSKARKRALALVKFGHQVPRLLPRKIPSAAKWTATFLHGLKGAGRI